MQETEIRNARIITIIAIVTVLCVLCALAIVIGSQSNDRIAFNTAQFVFAQEAGTWL